MVFYPENPPYFNGVKIAAPFFGQCTKAGERDAAEKENYIVITAILYTSVGVMHYNSFNRFLSFALARVFTSRSLISNAPVWSLTNRF